MGEVGDVEKVGVSEIMRIRGVQEAMAVGDITFGEATPLELRSDLVGKKEPVQQTRLRTATKHKSHFRGSLERNLNRPTMQMPLNPQVAPDKSKLSVVPKQPLRPTVPDELSGLWYCDSCDKYLNFTRRDEHLGGLFHFEQAHSLSETIGPQAKETPATVETDVCVDDVRVSTPSHAGANRDANYCVSCNKQLKNISAHLLSKVHLRKLKNYQPPVTEYEKEDHQDGKASEGAGGGAGHGDGGVVDRLNQLVRRRALEKNNSELCVMAASEPEIWNCTVCKIDMPPATRKSHEAHPLHVGRLEQNKPKAGGQMVGSWAYNNESYS